MSWVAVAVGVAGVASAAISSNAAKSAAKTQQAGYDAATAEQARQYDQTRADYQPYRSIGSGALNTLAGLTGVQYSNTSQDNFDAAAYMAANPDYQQAVNAGTYSGTAYDHWQQTQGQSDKRAFTAIGGGNGTNSGATADYSSFYNSPDYQFTRSEGQRDIGNSFASKGGAASGNALRALSEYNQGLASQQYNSYYNKVADLAGVGQQATNSTAQAGQNAANNISTNYIGSADARASGIVAQGNAWSNAIGTLGNYGTYNNYLKKYGASSGSGLSSFGNATYDRSGLYTGLGG